MNGGQPISLYPDFNYTSTDSTAEDRQENVERKGMTCSKGLRGGTPFTTTRIQPLHGELTGAWELFFNITIQRLCYNLGATLYGKIEMKYVVSESLHIFYINIDYFSHRYFRSL